MLKSYRFDWREEASPSKLASSAAVAALHPQAQLESPTEMGLVRSFVDSAPIEGSLTVVGRATRVRHHIASEFLVALLPITLML